MTPFILLYSILGNVLYVHNPPRVVAGVICFANDTKFTFDDYCHGMNHIYINNDTFAFSFNMTNNQILSNSFKILYYYSNKTIFDSNWNDINQKREIKNNETKIDLLDNFNFTINYKCTNIFDYLSFIINLILSVLITTLGILFYHYKTN